VANFAPWWVIIKVEGKPQFLFANQKNVLEYDR
jgi:hypothetical protein